MKKQTLNEQVSRIKGMMKKINLKEWSDEDINFGEEDFDDEWSPKQSEEDRRDESLRQEYRDKLERRRNGEETPEDRIGDDVRFTQNGKEYKGYVKTVFKEDGEDVFVIGYFENDGTPRLTGLKQDEFTNEMDDQSSNVDMPGFEGTMDKLNDLKF